MDGEADDELDYYKKEKYRTMRLFFGTVLILLLAVVLSAWEFANNKDIKKYAFGLGINTESRWAGAVFIAFVLAKVCIPAAALLPLLLQKFFKCYNPVSRTAACAAAVLLDVFLVLPHGINFFINERELYDVFYWYVIFAAVNLAYAFTAEINGNFGGEMMKSDVSAWFGFPKNKYRVENIIRKIEIGIYAVIILAMCWSEITC